VLFAFWHIHVRSRPYEFAFQNAIESWLYVVNIVFILLGGLYTLLNAQTTPTWVQALIEVTMVFVLVASCLVSGAYLAYGYWGNMQLEGLSRHQTYGLKSFEAPAGITANEGRDRPPDSGSRRLSPDMPAGVHKSCKLAVNEIGATSGVAFASGVPVSPFMRVSTVRLGDCTASTKGGPESVDVTDTGASNAGGARLSPFKRVVRGAVLAGRLGDSGTSEHAGMQRSLANVLRTPRARITSVDGQSEGTTCNQDGVGSAIVAVNAHTQDSIIQPMRRNWGASLATQRPRQSRARNMSVSSEAGSSSLLHQVDRSGDTTFAWSGGQLSHAI